MYLNKIDDLIDRIIDDFYTVVILNNKEFRKVLSEENFIKYQSVINDTVDSYVSAIPEDNLNEITKKRDGIDDLYDTLKRYCLVYAFLTIGATYSGKPDMFINNIIEFSKNQSQYSLRVSNFFNSESNAELIRLFYIIQNIRKLLEKTEVKYDLIRKEPYATETTSFMKEMGGDFINTIFRAPDASVTDRTHNIIKTVMILLVYRVRDKKRLYTVIEEAEKTEGEYVFIDVIEPITEQINFMTVESLLSKEDAVAGVAHEMWKYMQEIHEGQVEMSNDEKIDALLNSGIVVPILDDFLLYHRDTERYDRAVGVQVKKKEDTKIRYIIGKIDTITDLYSDTSKTDDKMNQAIMKNFSVPLHNRKAILRNDIEEIKIINKFNNQGRRNQENNDYYNDLLYFRRYTYINFKDFQSYGFPHTFSKTVTAVRAVNFDTGSDFKQINTNHKIQRRVGPIGSVGNVVGLLIPPNIKSIQCMKVGDAVDVRNMSKNKKYTNGYESFSRSLINAAVKGRDNGSALYWLFDLKKDSVKSSSFEAQGQVGDQSTIKAMVAELYDGVANQVYHEIIDKIDMVPNITPQMTDKIVKYMERHVLRTFLDDKIISLIKTHLYEKYPNDDLDKYIDDYDDTIYGIEGDVIELPEYKNPEKTTTINVVNIELSEVDITGQVIDIETVEGVCQHNITWDNISAVRRRDQATYMQDMYEFIKKYVVEDTSHDFVCKSCGFYLDISRYIEDGKFDDDTQRFVTFSMPMEVDLVELPEYSKLDFTIKLMDKNIDKIASSVGIPYFVGNNTTVKWRRAAIIKSTIDMVRANNHHLSKTFKARNETKESMYGVSKNLSSLFVFEMENNIYIRSSKDKDQEQFKMIKRNNITVYMMIYLIMELNESQISFFATDKKGMCDIRIFDKVYDSLFRGLRIKKNNANDTVPIIDYKILCYAIYMLSCRVAKHRMWYSPQSLQTNINKMIPIIQRFIVHTTIDAINAILENSFKSGVSYIFEIFRVRFYSKLNSLFKDSAYYDILLSQSEEQYAIAKRRGKIDPTKIEEIREFTHMEPVWRTVVPIRHFVRYREIEKIELHNVSNMTHCPSGDFHVWKTSETKGSGYVCQICKTVMADLKYDSKASAQILQNFTAKRMNRLAQKFCLIDGQVHQYVYSSDKNQNICTKCSNSDTHTYSASDLEKIENILNAQKGTVRKEETAQNSVYGKMDTKQSHYINDVLQKNRTSLDSSRTVENQFKYVDTFINQLEQIVGEEIKGNFPIHLSDNTYIIDHDYYGHKIDGSDIIIRESDKKVNVKIDHPHYKTDVIYYTDLSAGRVDVFYDAVSRRLLGYKESSKEYIDYDRSDKKIRINYSTSNKLKLMGFAAQYTNIYDTYPDLSDEYEGKNINDRQPLYRTIVTNMCRIRLENLKRVMLDFQRILNRVLNRYSPPKMFVTFGKSSESISKGQAETQVTYDKKSGTSNIPYAAVSSNPYAPENPTYFADKVDDLIERYTNRLSKMKITNGSGKHKVFKHWKAMTRGMMIDRSKKADIYLNSTSNVLDSYVVNRYDTESHEILHYLITEFTKMVEYNKSSFTKTSVANFLVEFIDRIFFEFNNEHLYTNSDIRRFMYLVSSPRYIREVSEKSEGEIKKEGFYDEVVVDDQYELTEERIEENIDEIEEAEALDMDGEEVEEGFSGVFDMIVEHGNNNLY